MIYILIAFIIVFAYVSHCVTKIGHVPSSISQTFYLGHREFAIIIALTGTLLAIGTSEMSETTFEAVCGVAAGSALIIVAGAAAFRIKAVRPIHVCAAIVFGASSQLWAASVGHPALMCAWLLLPLAAGICETVNDNPVFSAEVWCIATTMAAAVIAC